MKTIAVTIDAQQWRLPYSEVTALDVRDFGRETGCSLRSVLDGSQSVDLAEIAGLAWLALRANQPGLTFAEVASNVTLDAVAAVLVEESE